MIRSEVIVGVETVSSSGPMPMLMDKEDGCLEWEDGGTIFGWGVRKAWMEEVCHRAVVVMPRKIVDDSIIGGYCAGDVAIDWFQLWILQMPLLIRRRVVSVLDCNTALVRYLLFFAIYLNRGMNRPALLTEPLSIGWLLATALMNESNSHGWILIFGALVDGLWFGKSDVTR
jgi:hypothetical protein